jgi:hypothetical protein
VADTWPACCPTVSWLLCCRGIVSGCSTLPAYSTTCCCNMQADPQFKIHTEQLYSVLGMPGCHTLPSLCALCPCALCTMPLHWVGACITLSPWLHHTTTLEVPASCLPHIQKHACMCMHATDSSVHPTAHLPSCSHSLPCDNHGKQAVCMQHQSRQQSAAPLACLARHARRQRPAQPHGAHQRLWRELHHAGTALCQAQPAVVPVQDHKLGQAHQEARGQGWCQNTWPPRIHMRMYASSSGLQAICLRAECAR